MESITLFCTSSNETSCGKEAIDELSYPEN